MTLTLFEEPTVTPVWPDRPRYLLSYAYVQTIDMDLARKLNMDLMVDSGAFTTHNLGKQMDYGAYLEWLLEYRDQVTFALSLDVIGDHYQSAVNHERALEVVGDAVHMVPTFHLGSPMRELERLCDTYPLVCIGGAVTFAKQSDHLATVMLQIHRTAKERGTRLHGLGMTGSKIIHRFPWTSIDSSSWTIATRYPCLHLVAEDGRVLALEHGWHMDRTDRAIVEAYGGDPGVVTSPGWSLKSKVGPEAALARREWVMKASARAFMYAEGYKNGQQPDHPMRIYLSGNTGNLEGGAIGVIARAWEMGSPYPVGHPVTYDPCFMNGNTHHEVKGPPL